MFEDVSRFTLWVAGIGLVWNLIGVAAFVSQLNIDTADLPEAQRLFYETTPLWAKAGFFLAVFAGTVGCVALLIGQSWAFVAFALSLLGLLLQNLHAFVLGNGLAAFGIAGITMPLLVFAVAVFLLLYSRNAG